MSINISETQSAIDEVIFSTKRVSVMNRTTAATTPVAHSCPWPNALDAAIEEF